MSSEMTQLGHVTVRPSLLDLDTNSLSQRTEATPSQCYGRLCRLLTEVCARASSNIWKCDDLGDFEVFRASGVSYSETAGVHPDEQPPLQPPRPAVCVVKITQCLPIPPSCCIRATNAWISLRARPPLTGPAVSITTVW